MSKKYIAEPFSNSKNKTKPDKKIANNLMDGLTSIKSSIKKINESSKTSIGMLICPIPTEKVSNKVIKNPDPVGTFVLEIFQK